MSKQNNFQKGVVSSQQQPKGKFGLSEAAALRITQLLDSEPAGSFFRVAVLGGGCSGFQYDFSIDKNQQDLTLLLVQ